ncbi:armadillo repeat-containing protein 7-like [Bombyx mandarina]|uniref:Armadillo repeat-containing protein 7-like n=1 Tax=Bombyx mandarina TaxID=7092 RepID=A0A6J2JGE6_BOMMA|nr:armadillo repeat-containing protein 7-like [Bombyx mandarina]
MFSSRAHLQKRTPKDGTDREAYLSLLVDEYLHSSSYEAKLQVLANLANFAYDPVNYSYIRDVGVLDIFLYVLKNETIGRLIRYAIAGVCNLCLDPLNADYILTHLGLKPLFRLLKSSDTDTVADTITTLIYMYNEKTKTEITDQDVINMMSNLKTTQDLRIVNLTTVFLQDVCKTS